jgi:RNA polymerase sigma-70 factor (ECF subfamily)
MLSQGFAATPRALAAMAPELAADMGPVQRLSAPPSQAGADHSDRDLMVRVRHHDRDAFYQLYSRYHRRLASFLTTAALSDEAAEKIIDETFWVVWSHADSCDDTARVSTRIIQIAYRLLLDSLRRPARRERAAPRDFALGEAGPTDTGEATADPEKIKRALARLPLKLRLVLELAYYLGQSCTEIAQIMDCTVESVTARMSHARRSLKSILADDDRIGRRPDPKRTRPVSMCPKPELA